MYQLYDIEILKSNFLYTRRELRKEGIEKNRKRFLERELETVENLLKHYNHEVPEDEEQICI